MKKVSPQHLSKTMQMARAVQARYDGMKVASTQRVRNPIPMHTLILTVLPTMPLPDDVITVKSKITTTALGRKFTRTMNERKFAGDALGNEFWNHAMTASEVCDALAAKGFIVNPQTVRQMLSNAKHVGTCATVPDTSREYFARPSNRYFVRQNP